MFLKLLVMSSFGVFECGVLMASMSATNVISGFCGDEFRACADRLIRVREAKGKLGRGRCCCVSSLLWKG